MKLCWTFPNRIECPSFILPLALRLLSDLALLWVSSAATSSLNSLKSSRETCVSSLGEESLVLEKVLTFTADVLLFVSCRWVEAVVALVFAVELMWAVVLVGVVLPVLVVTFVFAAEVVFAGVFVLLELEVLSVLAGSF